MYRDIMLTLHLLTAIFAIGPLAHAATTAARGLRTADSSAIASSARMVRIYAYASVAVVIVGFGLMSAKNSRGEPLGAMSDLWIWLSVLLWLVAAGLAIGVVAPSLDKALTRLGTGDPTATTASADSGEGTTTGTDRLQDLRGRVAAAGGGAGLLLVVIVILMVFKPGS